MPSQKLLPPPSSFCLTCSYYLMWYLKVPRGSCGVFSFFRMVFQIRRGFVVILPPPSESLCLTRTWKVTLKTNYEDAGGDCSLLSNYAAASLGSFGSAHKYQFNQVFLVFVLMLTLLVLATHNTIVGASCVSSMTFVFLALTFRA